MSQGSRPRLSKSLIRSTDGARRPRAAAWGGLREVRIVELLCAPGVDVRRGDPLYVIETDKSTVELESPHDGRLVEWRVAPGDVVAIGATVVLMVPKGDIDKHPPASRPAIGQKIIPPRTRAYAAARGVSEVELAAIPALSEKILPADIDAHLAHRHANQEALVGQRRYKLSPVQRALVYHLRRSTSLVIPGTVAVEIPSSSLSPDQHLSQGSKPSPLQVLGHAVAKIAKEQPLFRSVLVDDDVVCEYPHVNLGFALARPGDELITAVVKRADLLTLEQFVRACTREMRAALRSGTQAADDTQILLTHLGEFGVIDAVPTLVSPANSIFFLGAPRSETGRAVSSSRSIIDS